MQAELLKLCATYCLTRASGSAVALDFVAVDFVVVVFVVVGFVAAGSVASGSEVPHRKTIARTNLCLLRRAAVRAPTSPKVSGCSPSESPLAFLSA